MSKKTELRRQKIFEDAVTAARELAEDEGLLGLTARRISNRIGCSVGTLYNVFDNLDTLILFLNAGTFDALHGELCKLDADADAETRVRATATTYLAFVRENANLWNVVFDHIWPPEHPIPDWYFAKTRALLAFLAEALEPLVPAGDNRTERSYQMATALWSGLHGICSLAAAGKLGIVTTETVNGLADALVDNFIAGLKAEAA
jgi:AcrR family transcriptional regulator